MRGVPVEIAEAGRLFGRRSSRGWGCGHHWRWRHGFAVAHDGDAIDDDGREWLVPLVALHARDGGDEEGGVGVALAEDSVFAIELRDFGFSDEELGAVGAAAGWAGAGVGH